jgi:orotate phosphoribosyltransferase
MNVITLDDAVKTFGIVRAPKGSFFTLASGKLASTYVDFERIMMTPVGVFTVVNAVMRELRDVDFEALGGPANGAIPIVAATLPRCKLNLRGFSVRKEPKGRGPNATSMIDEYLEAGMRVVMVEDVTTTGASLWRAIREVERVGAKVVKVISILDRDSGATELLANYNFVTLSKLGKLL